MQGADLAPHLCLPFTSDCCPFSATCYPFSVSQLLSETWQKVEAGVPVGWGCSEAAGARQLIPAMGRGGAVSLSLHSRGLWGRGKATRTSAAASHLAAHPPTVGLRSNARCRVPARREMLSPKTAGTWVCEGVRGDWGTPLGGAKPARTRTLRPGPTCSGLQALGQSVSRD